MVAYFDLENLESYLAQQKNEAFEDSLKMIKRQLDLSFNFSKEEFKKSEGLLQFIKILSDGIGDKKINYIPEKFPARNLAADSSKDFSAEELLSAYFINDEKLAELSLNDELLIADIGEEMGLFESLFLNTNDYIFDRSELIGSEFTSWNNLSSYNSPYIDLIFVDNFILSEKSKFEINLKEIVRNCMRGNCVKKINIIIFVKGDELYMRYQDVKSELSQIVTQFHSEEPNVTIIKHYKEHDRTILKNFIRIKSGDTFNYFRRNGTKETKGREIDFKSIASKKNYDAYMQLLFDLQETINNSLSPNIIGDKVSRFLNF